MSNKIESWGRLGAATWLNNPSIAKINDITAAFQKLSDGVGNTIKDNYSIEFSRMPNNLWPIQFLADFATDPNRTTSSVIFDTMGRFKKRSPYRIVVGDIYDIDALGPDNGSIVIVNISPGFDVGSSALNHWFIIQTITCEKTGSHPECGAREFGFEQTDTGVIFYTRGISRPANQLVRVAGSIPQDTTWGQLMVGFRNTIVARGGQWNGLPMRYERIVV